MSNILTEDRIWLRGEWYAVLQTTCFRLNNLVTESGTIDSVMKLMFKCAKNDSLDMVELSSDYHMTNFCALLNGILAFRDTKGRTFRISAVFKSGHTASQAGFCETESKNNNRLVDDKSISHFIVTVRPSSDDDYVFPLLGE